MNMIIMYTFRKLWQTDQLPNRPTDRPGHRELTFWIIIFIEIIDLHNDWNFYDQDLMLQPKDLGEHVWNVINSADNYYVHDVMLRDMLQVQYLQLLDARPSL